MEGTRPPTGASPTQPYKCGQYVKIKIQAAERGCLANAEINMLANAEINTLVLTLTLTF